jgi:hypothetical protein
VQALRTPRHPTVHNSQATPRKCEDYCEREIDEVEWQGGRVYLHLGARRDDPRG